MRHFPLFLKSYVGSDILISNILYLCCIDLLLGTASIHSQIQIQSISRVPVFSDLLILSIPLKPQFDDSQMATMKSPSFMTFVVWEGKWKCSQRFVILKIGKWVLASVAHWVGHCPCTKRFLVRFLAWIFPFPLLPSSLFL